MNNRVRAALILVPAFVLAAMLIYFAVTQFEKSKMAESYWHSIDYRTTPRGTAWSVIESLEYSGAITPEQAKKSMEYLKRPKKMEWPKE
jgi:hypothetical protein